MYRRCENTGACSTRKCLRAVRKPFAVDAYYSKDTVGGRLGHIVYTNGSLPTPEVPSITSMPFLFYDKKKSPGSRHRPKLGRHEVRFVSACTFLVCHGYSSSREEKKPHKYLHVPIPQQRYKIKDASSYLAFFVASAPTKKPRPPLLIRDFRGSQSSQGNSSRAANCEILRAVSRHDSSQHDSSHHLSIGTSRTNR